MIGAIHDNRVKNNDMKIELKDVNKGNKVWCGCNSGFCDDSIQQVKEILFKFDEDTGEQYKVIVLSEDHRFDSRNGKAITPPIAYCIMPTEQQITP